MYPHPWRRWTVSPLHWYLWPGGSIWLVCWQKWQIVCMWIIWRQCERNQIFKIDHLCNDIKLKSLQYLKYSFQFKLLLMIKSNETCHCCFSGRMHFSLWSPQKRSTCKLYTCTGSLIWIGNACFRDWSNVPAPFKKYRRHGQ